jgi:hypothetical protein
MLQCPKLENGKAQQFVGVANGVWVIGTVGTLGCDIVGPCGHPAVNFAAAATSLSPAKEMTNAGSRSFPDEIPVPDWGFLVPNMWGETPHI